MWVNQLNKFRNLTASIFKSNWNQINTSSIKMATEMLETKLCKTSDLRNNEMKEFEVDGGKLLVVKSGGQFKAVGHKCCHYGAPLAKAVLYKGKITCQWHGACFNVDTGDIEDFPGVDSLQKHEIIIQNDNVMVRTPKQSLKSHLRLKLTTAKIMEDKTFVIIGGGAAGFECSEALRQEGFAGKIIVISSEDTLPYDRTKLSKALNTKVANLVLRNEQFYMENDVQIKLSKVIESLNTQENQVILTDGSKISYDKLFIGSGSIPRKLNITGASLRGIYYVHTHNEANSLAEAAAGKNVVINGTSFIGMEVGSFLNGKATSINIIGRSSEPFKQVLGSQIGGQFKKLYESKGIIFHMNNTITDVKGKDGALIEVVLSDGKVLKADILVLGLGATPSTSFLNGSQIQRDNKDYIVVNKEMKTNLDNVYAGGDVVSFPLKYYSDKQVSIGHWQIAQNHGRIAASNMLGLGKKVDTVPFFWSMIFGKGLRYCGYCENPEDSFIHGDLENWKFVVYYFNNGNVAACATIGHDPVASMFAAISREGEYLKKDDILADPLGWTKRFGAQD